jgi:hypothetical protein
MNPNSNNNIDPETRRKANRALIIIYVVMAVFIIAPFLVYFLMK